MIVQYRKFVPLLIVALALVLSACNLGAGNPAEETLQAATSTASPTGLPTRTPPTTSGAPTPLPLTTNPTRVNQIPPTAIVVRPATVIALPPTNTFVPVNIVILSPVPGNVVAGAVQVFGSATHPNFLQYQVEFGPDPNSNNLWYPASAAVTVPVTNGMLGIWNTQSIPDGVYQLRLRVFLRDGTLLTTVVNNIRVQNRVNTPVPSNTPQIERPIAAFNVNTSSGQVPLTVNFTNQSSGQINAIRWDFGDNTTSTDANPVHVYANPGLYTVTLTVSGPGGSANVSRQISAQSVNPPVAGFTLDRTAGVAPVTIQFTDQSSGNITSYQWNFLDGTTSSERNPRHEFTIPGTYNVLLTVTGPGGSSTAVRQITVTSPDPPTATWTWTPSWTSIPPTWTWTPSETSVPPTWTWTPSPTFTFTPSPTDMPLTAAFVVDPVEGDPLLAQFIDQSSGGTIVRWDWNFGDNTTDNNQSPFHRFPSPGGTFLVTLTVTDQLGRAATTQQQVTLIEPATATFTPSPTFTTEPAPVANFAYASYDGNPLHIQFTNQSTGNIGYYEWDFGDGSRSNDQNPRHDYAQPGTYNVRLIVAPSADLNAPRGEITQQVTITPPLDAAFTFAPVEGDPLTVQFTDQSTGNIVFRSWDFGDFTTSNDQNPVHTFPATGGAFTVTLTVTDQTGATDTAQQQVIITPPLDAAFTFAPVEGDPLTVQFMDQSTGNISFRSWDFGDFTTSNDQNPVHTFPATGGTFTVTLTVTDQTGATDTAQQQVTITPPPTVEPTLTPTETPTTEPTPETPSIVMQTPILPNINALADNLRLIYNPANTGGIFSTAGDDLFESRFDQGVELLRPFAVGQFNLGENGDLQGVIDFYNAIVLADGTTSFNHESQATGMGWRTSDLLGSNTVNQNLCPGGASPLACELSATQPAVMLISIGITDAANFRDPNEFRAELQTILQTVMSNGTIPVLLTTTPRADGSIPTEQLLAINEQIIQAADDNQIPLINVYRGLSELPNSGMNGASLSVSSNGGGSLALSDVTTYGVNAINLYILRTLDLIRNAVPLQ